MTMTSASLHQAVALPLAPTSNATAPESMRPVLAGIAQSLGFVPNLFATFAHSPTLFSGYLAADGAWTKGSLTAVERELVLLTASVTNDCTYCSAAHSLILKAMLKADPAIVAAIRAAQPLADPRQDALVRLVREIVAERGHAKPATVQNFLAAGWRADQVLEVLLGIALKTISNYAHHLTQVAVDAPFQSEIR